MKKLFRAAAVAAAAALALTACAGGGSAGNPTDVSPTGEVKPREISWLLSRPADGAVINIMKKLADDYAKDHPGFSLNLITTPDRPSYIQKLETLAAANKLPELFDTDATPFAQQLAKQGKMLDADKLLKSLDLYDDYRPGALDYQRFDDGSLYMIPFQFELEFFWYNKALLEKAGVTVPKSLDDFPASVRHCGTQASPRSRLTGRTSGRWRGTWPTSPSGRPAPTSCRSSRRAKPSSAILPGRRQ